MIEAKPEENEDDGLFTEPADKELSKDARIDAAVTRVCDALPDMVADFYHGLRKRRVPKDLANKLTEMYLDFILVLGR